MGKRVLSLLLLWNSLALAGSTGKIAGVIKDAGSGEPLPGANIVLAGTALGAASSLQGEYFIPRVPPGTYTLTVSFIGYQKVERQIQVVVDETTQADFEMEFATIEGETVVVTALLQGQAEAINKQLSSNTIVNVVSSDRIQELPDQNAAESLGRLPGISVQRDAGEGQKVIVRGLAPKFNSITVNGERIPATDAEDRSVDLTMISPDILAGIEVFKALTPDKDADAVGGTVNFVIKRAAEGPKGSFRFQSGYHDHERELGQYKGSMSLSNRFFQNRVGVLVTGGLQRADRSSDLLTAEYILEGEQIQVDKLNLADRFETRDRFSASLTLDYDLKNGGILFSSLWGKTNRDEVRRRKRYRLDARRTEYDLRDRDINIFLLTNSLSGRHNFGSLELDWRGSLSRTRRKTPFQHTARFQELAAFNNDLIIDQGPELIPLAAKNNLDETWFIFGNFATEEIVDRDLTAQIDLKIPLTLGSKVAGYLSFGGKVRDKSRQRDRNELQTPFAETDRIGAENAEFELTDDGHIKFNNFADGNYSAGEFLSDRFAFGPGLDPAELSDFWHRFQGRYMVNRFALLDNYDAGERISAAYLMTSLSLGSRLTFLPGVRLERTENDYDAKVGQLSGNLGASGAISDSTGGQTYSEFLPMMHLQYKFTSNLDIRLAVTRTLSRPNYFNLVPFEDINRAEQFIERGNPNLKHTTAWNYDAFVSLYNRWGLFTVGVFHKKLQDIDYLRERRVTEGEFTGFRLTEPVNGEESTVNGFEVDLQTNLRFLPAPFSGAIINANYSFIDSETFYPFLMVGPLSPIPPFQPTYIDTVREGQLPGQPRHIANLSLGYEYRGFTGRVSMIFQKKSLLSVASRRDAEGFTDGFTDDSIRWDISVSQKITQRLNMFLNVNNFSNQPEVAFFSRRRFPTVEEFFGWTSDIGFRYQF